MTAKSLREKIDMLCQNHEYDLIKETLLSHKDITEHDNDLSTVFYLLRVYEQEKVAGQKTILEKTRNIHSLLERYAILKFYLRRIDFGVIDEEQQSFFSYLAVNQVSTYELLTVMEYSVIHKDKVLKVMKGESQAGESQTGTKLYE